MHNVNITLQMMYLLRLSVKRLLKIHGPASEIPALPSSLDSYV